jgi:glycosyltransferase involved in cell wall biosynthesis
VRVERELQRRTGRRIQEREEASADPRVTVCLVTPGHLATNPRLVKEADALYEAGFRVAVVAARFVAWAEEADREFVDRPWTVRTVAFGPRAPLLVYLWQSGLRRLAALLDRHAGARWGVEARAFHPAVPALARQARQVRAALYIAHNLAALPAAGVAARRHGARLGFDAEDFHLGELEEGERFRWERSLVRRLEARWLPLCRHLTAASPGIAQAYVREYGVCEPVVVLNVFPLAQAPARPQPPTVAPGPAVYWFSQTLGPDRGLETAVEALARATSRPHLYLRGAPRADFAAKLQVRAGELGVGDRLHFLPPIRPGQLVADAAAYHVGLAGEEGRCVNSKISLSNKAFTYLLAGVPVVLSDTPAQARLAAELGGAARVYPVGDAAGLAAALDAILGEEGRLQAAREVAWSLGRTRFNWDVEKGKFLASVAAALAAPADGE